jgi:Yip1 domain
MADSTTVGILTNIFAAPSAAFAAIKERPNPWVPLLVVAIGSAVVSYLYLQGVDMAWMLDRQISQGGGNLTDEQRTQAVDAALQVPPAVYYVIGTVSAPLWYLISYALIALYFTGVSFATNDGVKYGQWLAMIAWSMVPMVLGLAATFVNLLVSDARFLPPEQLNPLSFGNLLGIDTEGVSTLERSLLSLSVVALWIVGLLVVGHQVLSQRSVVRSAVIVLAPIVVIVLIGVIVAAL